MPNRQLEDSDDTERAWAGIPVVDSFMWSDRSLESNDGQVFDPSGRIH